MERERERALDFLYPYQKAAAPFPHLCSPLTNKTRGLIYIYIYIYIYQPTRQTTVSIVVAEWNNNNNNNKKKRA
eukprot:gene9530-6688_t